MLTSSTNPKLPEKSIADFWKIYFVEKVILPAFNLSESDTGRSSGSTMFGENSTVFPAPSSAGGRKREAASQEQAKRQELKRWSMKPCQLTRKVHSTEDLGKD